MEEKVLEPKVLTEDQVSSLIAQFRYMLLHEVKTMKLEVIETIGGMLARRSGLDKELRELSARVDLITKSVEGFAGRLVKVEEALGLSPATTRSPRKKSRHARETKDKTPAQQVTSKPIGKRRGRPKGSGYYSRMRMEVANGKA